MSLKRKFCQLSCILAHNYYFMFGAKRCPRFRESWSNGLGLFQHNTKHLPCLHWPSLTKQKWAYLLTQTIEWHRLKYMWQLMNFRFRWCKYNSSIENSIVYNFDTVWIANLHRVYPRNTVKKSKYCARFHNLM